MMVKRSNLYVFHNPFDRNIEIVANLDFVKKINRSLAYDLYIYSKKTNVAY